MDHLFSHQNQCAGLGDDSPPSSRSETRSLSSWGSADVAVCLPRRLCKGETWRFLIGRLVSGAHHFHLHSVGWNSVTRPLLAAREVGECGLCAQNQRKWIPWSAGSLCHLGLKFSDVGRFVLLPMMDLCSLLITRAWWVLGMYIDLVVINAPDSFHVLANLRKQSHRRNNLQGYNSQKE